MNTLDKNELALLCKVGFLACASGKVYEGRQMFESLLLALPKNQSVMIGLAFSHMVVDDFETSDSILQEIIEADSTNYDAIGLLALSYALQKRNDDVIETTSLLKEDAGTGYNLGQSALELINNR